ncbi:MAG: antibiotic biosynthesis monooxygenase [Chloroflexi bacterium]|nr:antibiotic biosynthesis monooxygenase [Chloroflexota bacterium]
MPFFVAIRQQAWPDRLPMLLAAIRDNFAASRMNAPGRHAARVFQRLHEPTSLLAISEWENQAAYEAHRGSAELRLAMEAAGPTATIDTLDRLHLFERMNERPGVVACVTIAMAAEHLHAVETFLLGPTRRSMVASPSLASRELYRFQQPVEGQRQLLVVHSWRSLADLDRFRSLDALEFEQRLRDLGATVDRFTGEIAAEYSRMQRLPDGAAPDGAPELP